MNAKLTLANILAALAIAVKPFRNEDGSFNPERKVVRLPPGETGEALFAMIVASFAGDGYALVRGFTYLWLSFPESALSREINALAQTESPNKVAGIETPPSNAKPKLALAPALWDDSDQPDPEDLKN